MARVVSHTAVVVSVPPAVLALLWVEHAFGDRTGRGEVGRLGLNRLDANPSSAAPRQPDLGRAAKPLCARASSLENRDDRDSTLPHSGEGSVREHIQQCLATVSLKHCQLPLSPLPSKWVSRGNKPKGGGGGTSTLSSEVWGDGVARKRGWGRVHCENKVLEPSAILLSCQQSHSGIICRAESD